MGSDWLTLSESTRFASTFTDQALAITRRSWRVAETQPSVQAILVCDRKVGIFLLCPAGVAIASSSTSLGLCQPPTSVVRRSASGGPHEPGSYSCRVVAFPRLGSTMAQ